MPNSTFLIASKFQPTRSLLGRWVRKYSIDARQAESTYMVAVVVALLALLLIHFLGWSFFQPAATGSALVFAAVETVIGVAFVAAAFAGRDPAITVITKPSELRILRAGDEELTIPYDAVEAVSRIDARTFHRHYRRYSETRAFVNHVPDELLLLCWNGTPVILGLAEDDVATVVEMFESRASIGCASSHVSAA